MTLVVTRIEGDLPESINELRALADAEDVRNLGALIDSYREGRERFAEPGALFAAWFSGELAGVGGVTPQPGLAEPAMRMRRLYVAPASRRRGIGRSLANAMIQPGFEAAALLTCNAQASPAAPIFWEEMGFAQAPAGYDFTHWMRRT